MANFFQNLLNPNKNPKKGFAFGSKPSTPIAPQYNAQNAPIMTPPGGAPTSSSGATGTNQTTITSPTKTNAPTLPPAGKDYAASLSGSTGGGSSAPKVGQATPQTAPTPTSSPQNAYLKYLTGMFDENNVNNARKSQEDSAKRLADIQSKQEKTSLNARREYEKELDTSGRYQSANEKAAQVSGRRSDSHLADLAVQESAAARSAQVAQNTYDQYISAGKSVYEAETAAAEAKQKQDNLDREFNEDKRQFGLEYALKKANAASSGGAGSNKLLSVAEAKALGVPYGTTEAQAIAMNKRPLTPAQQTAQNNANSALLSLQNLSGAIKNSDGTYKNMKLVTFGLGKIAQSQREIKDVISRIRTGAALTTNEENFYAKQTPNKYDTDETTQQKINQLTAFFSGISGSPVTLELPDGTTVIADDMFDEETRTLVRQAIADGGNVVL